MRKLTLFCAIALAIFSAGCGSSNSVPWNQNVLTYVARTNGVAPQIYTLDYKTKKIVPLGITLPESAQNVTVSPDGTKAAYCRSNTETNTYDLYVKDTKSVETDLTTIVNGQQCTPAFSPDGKTIAFMDVVTTSPNTYSIYLIGASAGGTARTPAFTDTDYVDQYPEFSPDGKTLAFYRYYNNSNPAITASSHGSASFAGMKSHASKATLASAISPGNNGLYTISLTANATPQLAYATNSWWGPATFSQDGKKLLLTDCDNDGPCSIATINMNGTYLLTNLPNTSGNNYSSPVQVGSVILFNVWANNEEDIWVMDLDGTGTPTQVIANSGTYSSLIDTYWGD